MTISGEKTGPDLSESRLASLLGMVARGSEASLAEFYDLTNRAVYGLALRVVRDEGAAQEVALDVYMQVWRTAAAYSAERGRPSTWLLTITRTRAIDRLRATANRRRREEPLPEGFDAPDGGGDPESSSLESERRREVRSAMAALPGDQRAAVELAFFPGLTHVEIAERLGVPLGTIKTRIRLGMMKLRERLRPLGDTA